MAGESLSLTVRPDDPSCGIIDDWVCRTVRLTAPATGTVTATLVSNGPYDQMGLEISPRGIPGTYKCCLPEVSFGISPGVEVMMKILMVWTAKERRAFTLHTSFVRQ